jgi:hypothetical protein
MYSPVANSVAGAAMIRQWQIGGVGIEWGSLCAAEVRRSFPFAVSYWRAAVRRAAGSVPAYWSMAL